MLPKIELPKIDFSELITAFEVAERISNIVGSSLEWQAHFDNQLRQIASQYSSTINNLAIDFAALDLAKRLLPINHIFQDLAELIGENKDLADAFTSANWSVAPSMNNQLKARVVELFKDGKSRYISNVIIGHYHRHDYKNLRAMIESWRMHPLFISRMHIIDDALTAHKSSLFTLSVPALLPLIEGILNEYVTSHNLLARCGKIKQVYEAVIGEVDNYSLSNWAIVQTLLYQLEHNTYTYTDFTTELQKSTQRRQVSRHTVLHGVATNYHTSATSLRVFVLLDALSALHSQISENHTA